MTLRQVRRIAGYGVCQDEAGRVLMVLRPGGEAWNLPGGGVLHGEDPAVAVVRKFREETGLAVAVVGVREVAIEVREFPDRQVSFHADRVVYNVRLVSARRSSGGGGRRGAGGGSHRVAWMSPAELGTAVLADRAREVLGVPGPPEAAPGGWEVPELRPDRGQRFSAYGVVTDPAGRLLLTLIADNYPGAGTWHLPGGGTDFGEEPAAALLRELEEETGQRGRITDLISVTNLHNPAAMGPEQRPLDWHGVRVTYRVEVDEPTVPVVAEVGGSTAAAGWFTREEAAKLRMNRPTVEALSRAGALLPRH